MEITTVDFQRWFLEGILKANVCKIHFTRVSGGVSTMRCTLKPEYLPAYTGDKDNLARSEQTRLANNIIAVWNLDKNSWRCFKVDNLINLEIEEDALPL
jgi:hypothetical protein